MPGSPFFRGSLLRGFDASKRVEDQPMITAIVRFKLPATIDAAKAAELFQGSAPKYQGLAGLVRKYYLFDPETRTGGRCSLSGNRQAAARVHTSQLPHNN